MRENKKASSRKIGGRVMEYNEVAAKWWGDTLRNIVPSHFYNGDESRRGQMERFFAVIAARKEIKDSKTIDSFEKKLAEAIKERVDKEGMLVVSVEFVPNHFLGEIAEETGINKHCFPWKTTMTITKEKIELQSGYYATIETIFEDKK